ncbi:uncharacterized protein LOC133185098 [Saccostrea echinata]|uniref:uncharacterized protein LOC133185098 n=1 Tax=Saccostrea echinata TaxID=191078 RepID=UPI002A810EAE|nr:uncharacterized protein LOC133185098 [Saccostrea echinata]
MDYIDFDSPNVGVSDTLISPWDLILHGLSEELDTDQSLLQEVCQRAVQDLGPAFAGIQNADDFFAALENNLSNDKGLILDYLIALVDIVNLYRRQGTEPFKDVLLQYKNQLTKYREDCARVSKSKVEEFIGREADLKNIEENLRGKKYQGVAICGMGGIGKTSLATEVCYRLQHAREKWHVETIDMREKEDLVDLLRDLVTAVGQECNSAEVVDLYSELITGLRGLKARTIFFMDNLDDMMKSSERKEQLLKFLEKFSLDTKVLDTKVRILLTVRQKLVTEEKLNVSTFIRKISRSAERLGQLFEVELQRLNQQEGVLLFKACCRRPFTAPPENEVCRKIVDLCGGSPLAIKSVGAAVRSGKVNPEMLAQKLEKDFPGLKMESKCLTQTFETLDKLKKDIMVKLHVFGTAKFDLACAAFVLGEDTLKYENPITAITNANLIYLKSRHFVEVDDLTKMENEDIQTESKSVKFSLHPLVHEFLSQIANNEMFKQADNEAKCLFIEYVEKKNSDIFEKFEKNCVKAWKDLKDFKVHLKTYYDLIQNITPDFLKLRKSSRSILTCKRISEVADLFLEDYVKFKLLEKFIEQSKSRGDFLETALWQVHLGRKFFESDRNEIAENILNCILTETLPSFPLEYGSLGPFVEVAGATFYFAGKLCLKDRKYSEALVYFENAKQLWANKLEKTVRNKYSIDLALVYNSLGKVHANLTPPNLQKSKYNHLKAFRIAYKKSENFNNIDIPLYIHNIGRCFYREGNENETRSKKDEAKQCFRDAENYYKQAMKLFRHFKMEKFDSFAEVQRSLAFAEMKLREMGLAEDDIVKAYELRKLVMSPPHEAITTTVHDVATIRIERAIYLYWEYFQKKIGDKYEPINKLYEAIADYEHVMHLTKLGGLPMDHPEYQHIKNNHIWALTQVKENKKIAKAVQFYKDFESGKFEATRKKRRSKKETTKFFHTYDELQTMLRAGAFVGAEVTEASSSDDDFSDDSDDDPSQHPKLPLPNKSDEKTPTFNLRKTRLNFNYVFRECPKKEREQYGDLSGDDYFIEEDFEEVDFLDSSNSCEQLMKQAKEMEMDVDYSDDEGDEGLMKVLERRTSDCSISSQSSLEEEDFEARRKRYARKGSREGSLQDFLENRLSESKSVTKGRLSSTSSTSIEISMDEDSSNVGERNPELMKLRKKIDECFEAKEKQELDSSQQNAKLRRTRMQRQPTINEEPGGNSDTLISPWDLIRHGLSQELDTDQSLLQEVCQRAVQDLGPAFAGIQNADDFFAALENYLSNDEGLILDYLIALVDIVNLQRRQGTEPFKDVLLQYKNQLTKYREDCARVSKSKVEEFIGREADLKNIEENLRGKKYQGVAICGMGGIGKTSLATEVCYRLQHAREKWHVMTIDMREKEDLVELLRDLVTAVGQECNSAEVLDLYSELITGLRGLKARTIFFMDNLDDMMKSSQRKEQLLKFLEKFSLDTKVLDTKVRILLTVRQKLVTDDKLKMPTFISKISRSAERLGQLFEVELKRLNQQDGVLLFKACCRRPFTAPPENEVCRKIVDLCGGSPLAIKSVGAAIRSGKVNPEMLAKKLEKDFPGLKMESRCLTQTFETLDKPKQDIMVKLHVFGTAKFDLASVALVLGEDTLNYDNEGPIHAKTRANLIYLKSRHFVEVDDLTKMENEDIQTESKSVKFSLHPLVHEFLSQIANDEMFKQADNEAKCLFIEYIEKKNSDIFEKFEKNCVKAWKDLKDFKVHLKTYYDLIQNITPDFHKLRKSSRSILTCKRISEVADLFLEDYVKFKLLEKFIEQSKSRGDFLETALWQVHLGRKFFESDRNEIAENILNCILTETLPRCCLDNGSLGPFVEVAGATFYFAGKLCLKDRKYSEAQVYFENAKQFWANKLEKTVRNKYSIDLALVYNSLGKVHANLTPPNLQKSKYNHLKAFRIAYKKSENFNNIDIPLYIHNIGRCFYREGNEYETRSKKEQAKQCFRDAENYYKQAMKLFRHFKMEKFDSFAEVQRSLAFAEMKLREMGLAEDDIVKAYELRELVMSPSHEALTTTKHDVATIRIERAIYLYWEYFQKKIDKYEPIKKLYEAITDYEHLMHLIKLGGLPMDHPEYQHIKNNHIWALTQVKENTKIAKAVQFYKVIMLIKIQIKS